MGGPQLPSCHAGVRLRRAYRPLAQALADASELVLPQIHLLCTVHDADDTMVHEGGADAAAQERRDNPGRVWMVGAAVKEQRHHHPRLRTAHDPDQFYVD